MNLRKTVVRILAAVALAASVAAAAGPLGPLGHAGPTHVYAQGAGASWPTNPTGA